MVLDHDDSAARIFSQDVEVERAGRCFPAAARELDADRFPEHVEVVVEPTGEVVRLMAPHVTNLERLDAADALHAHQCDTVRPARTAATPSVQHSPWPRATWTLFLVADARGSLIACSRGVRARVGDRE